MNVRKTIKPTQVFLSLVAMILSTVAARADITSNLEVRYRLDGSSAADSSGNGKNGTLTNGAVFTASGRFGGGVDLAGTNQYINCPAIPATSGATALTIAFWVYVDELEDFTQFCGKRQNFDNLFIIGASTTGAYDNNDLLINIHKAGTNGYVYTTGDVISTNEWFHVTVVYDNSQSGDVNKIKVYKNGQLVARTLGAALPTSLYSGSETWGIGCRPDNPGSLGLNGKVDEFYMYSRALTASDVLELYNWQAAGFFSCDFNALTSKIENSSANVLSGSNEMTICAWVYQAGVGENGSGVIAAIDETANAMLLRYDNTTSTLRFSAAWDTNAGVWTFEAPQNTWNALAVSYDRSNDTNNPRVRVNFASVQADAAEPPEGTSVVPGPGYCIGNLSNQNSTWDGRIAHVQLFNRILSAAEMDAALKAPGSVKRGLRVWLPMSNETDINDRSGNGFNGTRTDVTTAINGPVYDNLFQFGLMDETVGQIVIPPNGSEPAISVRGRGTRTRLTASGSLIDGSRFITTEAFGIALSQVIEPTVADVYLFGDFGIPDFPYGSSSELAIVNPVCHAIAIDGDAAEVTGCKIFDFRGDGIHVKNSTSFDSALVRIPRVRDNKISHCWTGIRADAVDAHITGNRVANTRDYGIRCLAGSEQLSGNHSFGSRVAISAEGGFVQSTNDRFADAPVGFQILSNAAQTIIQGGTALHCWNQSIMSKAQRVNISNCFIDVPNTDTVNHPGEALETRTKIVGIWLHWNGSLNVVENCFLRIGEYTFSGDTNLTGSIGVYVQQHNCKVTGLRVFGSARDGEVGCLVASGRNSVYIEVDSSGADQTNSKGFYQSNDAVLEFEDANSKGIAYVTYSVNEIPVRIPSGWGSGGQLKIFKRLHSAGSWTELTPEQAYP